VELPFRIKFSLKPKIERYELQPSQSVSITVGSNTKTEGKLGEIFTIIIFTFFA
jgi:hypothetical protein